MDTFDAVVQRLCEDPAVWNRVQSELATAEDRQARFVELAAEYGMNIDAQELQQILAAGRELDEDELGAVAGGFGSLSEVSFNPQPEPPVDSYYTTPTQRTLVTLLQKV